MGNQQQMGNQQTGSYAISANPPLNLCTDSTPVWDGSRWVCHDASSVCEPGNKPTIARFSNHTSMHICVPSSTKLPLPVIQLQKLNVPHPHGWSPLQHS
jgi:hypothetical protein